MRNLKMHLTVNSGNVLMSFFLNFLKPFSSLIGGKNISLRLLLLGVVALFVFQDGFGAAKTWDGGAGTNNWGDGNNWNPNGVPLAGDDITLSGNSRTVTLNVVTPVLGSVTLNVSGNNGTNTLNITGFALNTNSLTINGGNNTNRFATLSVGSGTLTCTGNISFSGTATQARIVASGTGQVGVINITGNFGAGGTFLSTVGTSSVNVTCNGSSNQTIAGYTYYNLILNNAVGVTLGANVTVSNILTLTSGVLTTTPYLLSVTNTATNAIVGNFASSYIDGPLSRTLPANLLPGSTYIYPIGSTTTYLPFELVNATTGAAIATARVQATSGNAGGTLAASITSKSATEFWALTTGGGFINSSISITRPAAISPFYFVGGSTTQGGNYSALGGTVGANSVSNSNLIGTNRFFTFAEFSGITTGTIGTSSFCQGATVSVPYTITGTYTALNNFTAQLSNEVGSFVSPVNIGAVTSTAAGTITAIIPSNTVAGSGYRIRVVSNTPVRTGTDNGVNLTVSAIPSAPTTTGGLVCIGSTATLSASGAVAGEVYVWYDAVGTLLKTSTGNTDNTYTTAVIAASTNYWVAIMNAGGCESTTRTLVTATFPTVSADNQNAAGTNSWIGHVYDGTNFNTYYGSYAESESFNQNFGGDAACFNITSNSILRSINTEQFSVRYRMNSTKKGLYTVDMGSDDGGRLTVDGTLLYNNWADQAFSTKAGVLLNLSGASSLVYEFYENGGGNQVVFQNLTLRLANTLSANTTQTITAGDVGSAISGDVYGILPAGITVSGTGYQWTYSTTLGGARTNITGATGATYAPNTSVAPFNVAGTYYIFRNAVLSSANNMNPNPYVATSESNACTLIITNSTRFRSLASGNWNLTSTWESSSDGGATWVAAATIPTSADELVTIQSPHTVTLTTAESAKSLTVNGTLDLGVYALTGTGSGSLLVSNTGTLKIGGPSNIPSGYSTVTLNATSTVEYYYAGNQTIYETNYGNLILSGSGAKTLTTTVAITANALTVGANANLLLNGNNSLTPVSAAVNGTVTVSNTASLVKGTGVLSFNSGSTYNHNRDGGSIPISTWNVNSTCLVSGITATGPVVASLVQSFGNFTWNSANQTVNFSLAGNLRTVNGNLLIESTGTGSVRLVNATNSVTINVAGNYTQTGGTLYVFGTGTGTGLNIVLNVLGNFSISNGIFDLNGSTTATTTTGHTNIAGNFTMSGGSITESGSGTANFNFNGSTVQTYIKTAGTFENTVNFGIGATSTVDFGTYILNGSNGTFNLLAGGTVITANTGGFSATGATGSVQTTGIRNYSAAANYVYKGAVLQITGLGLPTVLSGNLTINNSGAVGNNTVTLSAATSLSGVLNLTSGLLLTTTNLLSVTNISVSAIVGGSSSAYIDGSLRRTLPASLASGSTYNYPVGSGIKYLPFSLVNPTTTSTGTPTVQVRAYTTPAGGFADATLDSISTTGYWMLTPTANVTNTSVSMTRTTAISPLNVIAGSVSLNGTYVPYDGNIGSNGITNSSTVTIASVANRYFVFGKRKPGVFSTVTALSGFTYKENLGPSTIQSFTVSGYSLTNNLKLEMLRGNYELSTSNAPSFVGSGVLYLPVVNGVVSPTTVYIRLKAGLSENALITDSVSISSSGYTSKIVNCSGSVTTPAKLTASPATLTMSNYTFGGGPSVAQSFIFSGTLLNGNVTITPPADFEIATAEGGTYQSTAFTYTPSGGTLGNTTLWARMKSGLGVGTHIENIVVASSGAVSKNITCSGTVNAGVILTNSTSFLGAFSYTLEEGPSDAQSFLITGQNLAGNVVVTPTSTNFRISTTLNGTYQTSALSISASGSFSQIVYVKMSGGLGVGTYGPTGITIASAGAVTKSVACAGQVFAVATAAITTSTSSVSGFGYKYSTVTPIGVQSGGPSNPQSFVVSGVYLSNDITVAAPTNFEVSATPNGTYSNSITLARNGVKVLPITVYVRLKSGLAVGTYLGSVSLTSGSTEASVTCNSAKVYASPLISSSGNGDYCLGSTINLGSTGADIKNRYWEGPNNYYSILQNPTLTTNATANLSGDYIVAGNVVVGGNLIYNGDFESGNVGFGSAYGYPATPFNTNSLVPEGLYSITTTGSVVHYNFNNIPDKNFVGTKQMIVNGNKNAGAVVWSQNVAVVPNADYEFSYWLQTVVNGVDGAPSKLQLYVNGVAAGPIYTANPNSGNWAQYLYNTNANSSSTLNLELINQTTSAGGNDFALDSITFTQVLIAKDTVSIAVGSALPVSVSLVASQNPVNTGVPVTYTATPVNGGIVPTYKWYVNNVLVSGAPGSTYTYIPSNGDLIKCVLTSSLTCVTVNSATSNTVAQVVNVVVNPNYWYGSISTDWGTSANWTDSRVPNAGEDVEYATIANYGSVAARDLYVDTVRTIGSLINATTRRLVVLAGKSLSVNNSITTNNNVNTIYIESSSTLPTGTLIFNNAQNYPVYATVDMYSPASWDLTRPVTQKYNWQFFGIPLRSVVAVPTLTGSYVRRYLETGTTINNHWQQLSDESVLYPFYAYELCQKAPKTYTFKGQLVNSNFNSGQLAKTIGAIYPGQHIFANPYTAGMDIRQIQFGSDMEASVYMYHTGTFGSWSSAVGGKVGESAGQYVSVPQNQAGYSKVPRQVPAMGSMLVRIKSTVPTSTVWCYVNFNYRSLVMKNAYLLRAPSARNKVESETVSTRIDVTGNNSQDKMWIFTNDSCSREFDNGNDGIKMLGIALQPQIYAVEADGNYQINALNDMNNTTIAFQAGEDTEYTLTFNHESTDTKYEKIYLHDLVENTISDVTENGSIYKFTAVSTPKAVNRFRIISKSTGEGSNTQSNVKLFVSDQSIYVQNFSDTEGTVYLYDVTGRLHATTRISPNGVVSFAARLYNAYIVKTVLINETVTEKIVLK